MDTIEIQLNQLRLHGMKQSWQNLVLTRKQFDFSLSEGLDLLLDAEILERNNRRLSRLQKDAKFRYQATIEQLKYDPSRGLDKSMIQSLATCQYVKDGASIIITGATGCGKSYIASAFGHQACLLGHKVLYFSMHKLMLHTKMARIDGTIYKYIDKLAKSELLIIDDFGLAHLDKQQQMDLMEIIEDRHGKNATIIASQLPVSAWFDIIGEPTIADAILDRLAHTSYKIEIKGDSLRKNR
ncbi:MAG: IS21-like element helper ATPase IstB [Saprospiraceae bacterium]